MIRPICIAVTLALAPACGAYAHGMNHAARQSHATTARTDEAIIARCGGLHFSDRVTCLYSTRGQTIPAAYGATTSSAGGAGFMHVATSQNTTAAGRVDAKPLEDLEAAAQRLRDAVHALAHAPAGEKRNEAIRQANRTLLEVQNAMASLPPSVITTAGSESNYKAAMDRLEMAAQRLRDATHALAREPVGAKRADSMKAINKALLDTQQVMLDLPLTRTQ